MQEEKLINPIHQDIKPILDQFLTLLETVERRVGQIQDIDELLNVVETDIKNLCQLLIVLGDAEFKNQETQSFSVYVFNFLIPKSVKIFGVFARDVYFESAKAKLYHSEDKIDEVKVKFLCSESQSKLLSQIQDLKVLGNPKAFCERQEINYQDILLHQDNPWEVYKSQFETLVSQIDLIKETLKRSLDISKGFFQIRSIINKHSVQVMANCTQLKSVTNQLADLLDQKREADDIIKDIESWLKPEEAIDKGHQQFTEELEFEINKLQSFEIPTKIQDGLMTFQQFDIQTEVRKWLDFEVLSNFYDLWALKDNLKNYFRINLTHIKNNLLVQIDAQEPIDYKNLGESLEKLFVQINKHQQKEEQLIDSIKLEIDAHFLVSNYFVNDNPLDVPLKSSINLNGNSSISKIKDWFVHWSEYLTRKIRTKEYSAQEKAVKIIYERSSKVENEQYDALFLNKNFIGDLFLVHRLFFEDKLRHSYKLWQDGFAQSSLITGKRLSGKSTFLNYSTSLIFKEKILHLEPNAELSFNGRKLQTNYDLKQALRFVKHTNAKHERLVVVIDDLELWLGPNLSLMDNVRALVKFLEKETEQIYVMVSVGDMLYKRLDNHMKFSNFFGSILDVSVSDLEHIQEAIQIRHGASHKTLYNEKLEVISAQKMRKIIKSISRWQDYNIGEVLQMWTYLTTVKDYNQVVFEEDYNDFPNICTDHEQLLLKQLLTYKVLDENQLKKILGQLFEDVIQTHLIQMLNKKIIVRNIDQKLMINPLILHDIERQLNTKRQ
jgi:uncharacterized protein related to proFAR isomerase